ncbi:MAG: type II nitroreductase [Sporothrix thermara]
MASATKPNADTFLELMKGRRSHYALSKDLPVSKDRIQEIIKEAVRETPSSFNSQSNRVVVLFGDEHDKFWGIVTETLKAIVPAENWESTNNRMNMFKAGAGSVLFFEDQTVVEGMQAKFAIYADRFPLWALQTDAMLQFAVWTALEAEGLGANLQHYNPLVDKKVAETWKIPSTWKLNAQLVFGARAGEANPKDQMPMEERYKVFGA